jgi:outer membrane receptor protein involved in Fe transport
MNQSNFKIGSISLILLVINILSIQVFSQTTGSISGKVIDITDKSPLQGAVIKIEGTTLGAIADDFGEYVILNIEVGTYNVSASSFDYHTKVQNDVKISVDQRVKLDFELEAAFGLSTDTISIVAKRTTFENESGRTITSEQVINSGIRGIQNIIALSTGVVQDERGQAINIRGGREDENLIIVDGVATTNPLDGSSTAYVPNSLLQEISVYTGGFGAEYGNVLSGVINITTRGGSSTYTGSMEAITDELSGDWIKTTSQGYNLYNISFGGPIIPVEKLARVINFYGGVEKQFLKVNNPSWIADKLFSDGIIPNYTQNLWSYNFRLNVNLNEIEDSYIPFMIRSGYSQTDKHFRNFIQSYMKTNSYRNPVTLENDRQIYGRLIHNVSSNFFYELQGNYYRSQSEFGDPFLMDNWFAYGDTNSIPGLTQQGSRLGTDPNTSNVFFRTNRVNNFYDKTDISYIGAKLDATYALITQKTGNHEFKFGGEYRYHTLRKVQLSPVALANNPITGFDSLTGAPVYQLDPVKLFYGREVLLKSYGYEILDQYGNAIVSGIDLQPRNPIVASAFFRDKMDFGNFSVNAGIRMDYLDVNTEVVKDLRNLTGNDGVLLSNDDFEQSKANITFSPRLGFSFPVTEDIIFIANYGRFIQLPQLQLLYTPREYFRNFFSNSVQNVLENSSLTPERLTSYEVGYKQQINENISYGITAFYKETRDQIGTGRIASSPTVPVAYAVFENSDFSIARGLEFYLNMRRLNRAAVDIAYTLSYASGVGSDPFSKFSLANNPDGEFPKFLFASDFDQRHTGSVNIDYRFGNQDVPQGFLGEVLRNSGMNILFSFNSGRPYTKRTLPRNPFTSETENTALSPKNILYTDWNTRLDLRIDKTVPVWKTNWNFYVYVINLFNSEIINKVYGATGRPDDNGYLNTPTGVVSSDLYKENFYDRIRDITNWGPPRQVRFGIKVNF